MRSRCCCRPIAAAVCPTHGSSVGHAGSARRHPAAPAVRAAQSLAVAPDSAVTRRISASAHGNLLVLERTVGDTGKLRTEIAVADVRRTVSFFGSTAGEGGWRVCIVDSTDELNRFGTNALLKILEEPPAKSLLLLVSHAPGRLLPTIRSRCRMLTLRPLSDDDVLKAAAAALAREPDDELRKAVTLAEGSVARAIALHDAETLALRERVVGLLSRLPATDDLALHALGDSLGRGDEALFDTFLDTIRGWLSGRLAREPRDNRHLAQAAEAWEKFNRATDDVQVYNLDRKPLVFATFAMLAEAARG
jgi:DNA polymerase-3 subunit delta'